VGDPRPAQVVALPALKRSEAEFRLLLEHFDVEALTELVKEAIDPDIANPLLAYLEQYLEGRPTSLPALYLVGALTGSPESALLYLKFGFEEGLRQQLSPEGLLLFYREGCSIDLNAASAWLTQSGSPWAEDWPFLMAEAADRYGTDSPPYRSLRLLQRIRAIQQLSDRCMELTAPLAILQRGFAALTV
ncbi:MAG: hypothetical protein F6K28_59665, partial [Microcoleus sp. SIO2G3]|nr:hypothetical protein [Microcoleus sp. SIO2G3]